MERYTQKQLKALVNEGIAESIDFTTNDYRKEIEENHGYLTQIGYAAGAHGCSGGLLKARDGKLFAITSRNKAIYIYL